MGRWGAEVPRQHTPISAIYPMIYRPDYFLHSWQSRQHTANYPSGQRPIVNTSFGNLIYLSTSHCILGRWPTWWWGEGTEEWGRGSRTRVVKEVQTDAVKMFMRLFKYIKYLHRRRTVALCLQLCWLALTIWWGLCSMILRTNQFVPRYDEDDI